MLKAFTANALRQDGRAPLLDFARLTKAQIGFCEREERLMDARIERSKSNFVTLGLFCVMVFVVYHRCALGGQAESESKPWMRRARPCSAWTRSGPSPCPIAGACSK